MAEVIINEEQKFIKKRKDAIRKRLKQFDMTPTGFRDKLKYIDSNLSSN